MNNQQLKLGDVVKLKSGSPQMTIQRLKVEDKNPLMQGKVEL